MGSIAKAIKAMKSRELGDNIPASKYAAKYDVNQVTLRRRWKGVQAPRETKNITQQNLSPQQELGLVEYINELTDFGIPPTRDMIRNFGSAVAERDLSESWVQRFIERNRDHLISRWSTGIDRNRHQADTLDKYDNWFDLLHSKIEEHKIEPRLLYNMDEKGFMIGVEKRSKRWFSKQVFLHGGIQKALQDGNRDWITALCTICADGTTLPPALIYEAMNDNVRDIWVEDIQPEQHQVYVASSPSGWTNERLGLAWLKDVFDANTKSKARRKWRLLIVDGHGSHITRQFIDHCIKNRIFLAILPPHSTHQLQPLDVVMYSPLSAAYSSELQQQQYRSLGLLPVKKADFFPLFWSAYTRSFKEKSILSAFEATGIWPMDRDVVTSKFRPYTPPQESSNTASSHFSPSDWKCMGRLVDDVVKDRTDQAVRKLETSFHRVSTKNKLLRHQNKGLLASLDTQNKRKKNGRNLPLERKRNKKERVKGEAAFYSPRSLKKARTKQAAEDAAEAAEALKKVEMRELRAANALYKKKIAEENREKRAQEKEVKEKEKADKAAEARRKKDKKAEANRQKALQTSQTGKRKASRPLPRQQKRQKQVGGGAALSVAQSGALPPLTRTTRTGRNVTLPSKFR
jgi:hypothetical protein